MNEYTFLDINGNKRTFRVGDDVLYKDGRIGKITHICGCDKCKERGFCEPTVRYLTVDGREDTDYISDYYYKENFSTVYKIGGEVFGQPPLVSHIENRISEQREIIKQHNNIIERLERYKVEIKGVKNVRA